MTTNSASAPRDEVTARDRTYTYAFKGMRRSSTLLGVPLWPALAAFALVWLIQTAAGLIWWLLLLAIWPTLAMITKHDDRAFHVLWLAARTRWTNTNKRFWSGSSYTPLRYPPRRPWRRKR